MKIRSVLKDLSALFVGAWFVFVGNGLILTSAGVMLKDMGISDTVIGFISSSYFLGALFGIGVGYKFTIKFGFVRSYAIFTALFAMAAILHDMSSSIIFWAILRFLLGLSYYGLIMVVENWINVRTTDDIRSRVFTIYTASFYIAFAVGVVILGIKLQTSQIFIVSVFCVLLGMIPLNLIQIKPPNLEFESSNKVEKFNIFKLAPLGALAAFFAGILVNGFLAMAGVYVLGLPNADINDASRFLFAAMIGAFLSQIFFGQLSDKLGRKYSIIISVLIGLAGGYFLMINSENFIFHRISAGLLALGVFSLYALALARANDMANSKNETAKVGAAILFIYSIGSFLGPTIMGISMEIFGVSGFIYVFFVCLVTLLIFALTQPVIPSKDRSEFIQTRPSQVVVD
ncbi:MFS transporter [Campylobacter corcagiensis]|uniref:MFS transporter n=1 Tax=Campylobacter corcagiensis TaxID=1448857 RepID=UPI0004704F39|nr:MFS transporter [Campylobacter corcagiensis]QKF64940.1 major facilitator superfamily transporter [Campylobacter corcagiensis]